MRNKKIEVGRTYLHKLGFKCYCLELGNEYYYEEEKPKPEPKEYSWFERVVLGKIDYEPMYSSFKLPKRVTTDQKAYFRLPNGETESFHISEFEKVL